jgi:hypothetical protein
MNSSSIAHTDARLTWAGAVDTVIEDGATFPLRFRHSDRSFLDPELVARGEMPAGVRVRFATDSTRLAVRYRAAGEEPGAIDLVRDGEMVGSERLALGTGIAVFNADNQERKLRQHELWLPQYGTFGLQALEVDGDSRIERATPLHQPKWIAYGSSITQCRAANSPTRTWPARVARSRGWDLTCLGYGGQCHLDLIIARTIRDLDAELISLCVGINIYGQASLNARTFVPSILGFVALIREGHPHTPLILISPILSPPREDVSNSAGLTLSDVRREVHRAADILTGNGDANVFSVNGLDLFAHGDITHLPDQLHPDDAGYAIMAERFLTQTSFLNLEGRGQS